MIKRDSVKQHHGLVFMQQFQQFSRLADPRSKIVPGDSDSKPTVKAKTTNLKRFTVRGSHDDIPTVPIVRHICLVILSSIQNAALSDLSNSRYLGCLSSID